MSKVVITIYLVMGAVFSSINPLAKQTLRLPSLWDTRMGIALYSSD